MPDALAITSPYEKDSILPPQSPAMNASSDVGDKRTFLGGEVPPEAKRIRIEVDVPPSHVETKLEVATAKKKGDSDRRTGLGSITPPLNSNGSGLGNLRSQDEESSSVVAESSSGGAAPRPATPERIVAEPRESSDQDSAPLVSPKDSTTAPGAASASFTSTSSSLSIESSQQSKLVTPPSPPLPLKATQMSHLRKKYLQELEYMLREFRKLERQLLGAKGNGVEESAGSRERREKLHSFITHLDDTIRQIEVGCKLEEEGKSTVSTTGEEERQQAADSVALSNLTQEKEEEENVQKLEEHILANLLPVKVRLKKQLAAQQGATRNPIGMPAARQGLQPSTTAEKGKGTFAAAAEERRKLAEAARAAQEERLMTTSPSASSQFGKPLSGGGSSLTQKLHGPTLGSQNRKHGHGVGSAVPPAAPDPAVEVEAADQKPQRNILYAGMAPGSKQHQSGVSAAAGVHEMIIKAPEPTPPAVQPAKPVVAVPSVVRAAPKVTQTSTVIVPKPTPKPYNDPNLTDYQQKKVRKDRRKRKKARELRRLEKERQKQLFLQQQAAQAAPKGPPKKVGKFVKGGPGKKKCPKSVEYICALCSEAYTSSCDYNPWWALASHECPKCHKTQIPRIDIASPANAIEYHPALLAHAEEGGGGSVGVSSPPQNVMHQANPNPFCPPCAPGAKFPPLYPFSDTDEESDLSELSDAGSLSDDSNDSDSSEDDMPLTEGELAELEVFGKEYDGPKLAPDQASRLLILMGHAQTCPGRHKGAEFRDCCNSVKYLMLHVRDCPGTTSTFDVCPFPWCRKVKHLLYHLVACPRPRNCAICSPMATSTNLHSLIGLNSFRQKKHSERVKAAMCQAATSAQPKPPPPKVAYVKASKPVVYRPPIAHKKTSIVSKCKAPVSNPVTVASRITPISRVKPVSIRTISLIKPSNGVVVKSLVKPVGKTSVVVVKARQQHSAGTKPTVAGFPGLVSGMKPTVAALPCIDPINKAPVISSIVPNPKVLEQIPLPAQPPVNVAAQASAVSTQPKLSSEVKMDQASGQLAANSPKNTATAQEGVLATVGASETGSTDTTPVPALIGKNPQAVAVASAIAANLDADCAVAYSTVLPCHATTDKTLDKKSARAVTESHSVVTSGSPSAAITEQFPSTNDNRQTAAPLEMPPAIPCATAIVNVPSSVVAPEKRSCVNPNSATAIASHTKVEANAATADLSVQTNHDCVRTNETAPTLSPRRDVSTKEEGRSSPPRFPEVPSVVKEESAEEAKADKATPKEVPPV